MSEKICEHALAVWWLSQDDYGGWYPRYSPNPLKVPDYVWRQFVSRCGRPGRGRLWVPDHINLEMLPVPPDDPRWHDYHYEECGGIVIERKDMDACLLFGGRVTTLSLEYLGGADGEDSDV